MSEKNLKRQLQSMDDEKFEYFIADLWRQRGWQTQVSQKSRDKSLDVLAEKQTPYHQRHAIQVKRYQSGNNVGGPKIAEYASLRDQFDADAAIVVTTSDFTQDARERAETLNVKLIDGDDLVDQIEQLKAYDLVEEYLEFTSSSKWKQTESDHDPRRSLSEADQAIENAGGVITLPPEDVVNWGNKGGQFDAPNIQSSEEALEFLRHHEEIYTDGDGIRFISDVSKYIPIRKMRYSVDAPVIGRLDPNSDSENWRMRNPGKWHYGIILPIALFAGQLLTASISGPNSQIADELITAGATTVLLGPVLLLAAFYFDIKNVRRTQRWSPSILYLIGAFAAGVTIPIYLIQRYRHVES